MLRKFWFPIIILSVIGAGILILRFSRGGSFSNINFLTDNLGEEFNLGGEQEILYPLTIESLRKGEYSGSDLTIEQTLSPGTNYDRYIASYKSEGLKIFGLLTIPNGQQPAGGWPAIIFIHGYIPPAQYSTTERYVAYVDGFARDGYVVFKPDLRGHGNSEGEASGGYGSNAYTIDALNAVSSVKRLRDPESSSGRFLIDKNRIGMWGHSLGGFVTLRAMVARDDIKAGVIWAGVVGSYEDLLNNWRRGSPSPAFSSPLPSGARRWRQLLVEQYGTPEQNPQFWDSISATNFLGDISGPLQLHHGTADSSVPVEFSEKLAQLMSALGKESEIFTYAGDDHNLSNNFNVAMARSVEFFGRYLKNR